MVAGSAHSSVLTGFKCLQGHLAKVGPGACAHVRVLVIANKAMATRAVLEREAANWLDEAGFLPPGNGRDRAQWEVSRMLKIDGDYLKVPTQTYIILLGICS